MKQKLNRLLRFKTENSHEDKPKTQKRYSRLSGAFSIRKLDEKKQSTTQRQLFAQKNPNTTCTFGKSILKNMKKPFERNIDQIVGKSLKFDIDSKQSRRKISKSDDTEIYMDFLTREVQFFNKSDGFSIQMLQRLSKICDQIIEEVYSYNQVQNCISLLNQALKQLSSKSLVFLGYCLSAQCLFIYGSYSLAIYYADKALKLLGEKESVFKYERQKESDIYRTVTKIFLIKNNFKTAKEFGYKYLRKAWFLRNYEKQVDAYDLLGKIYHELEEKSMSIYFHNRMCKGERQELDIIRISNYELDKSEKQERQFAVYETIEMFVRADIIFHQMLEDRFRMKNRNFEFKHMQSTNHFFFHTHRSPNRNLNTYRILERKMIQEKKSKQLHFIKPKQKANLKKLVGEFSKILSEVSENLITTAQSSNSIENFFIKTT